MTRAAGDNTVNNAHAEEMEEDGPEYYRKV